ncbi:MAG: amidohydrolase [Fretibacterium sp.]|nr:amidohydrolase [Fretibacterium sp.]
MAEFQTTALVKSELEAMGVAIHPLSGEVGALGILEGTAPGSGTPQVLGLRADMDALPIQETADVPDRSVVPGVMHACGHDCHTAMLLGAARLLSSMRDRFSGTVKFIFQPAEETLGGSDYMIDQGVLENPKVDCIISLHGHSGYRLGEIALREGPYMASSDFFTATLIGQAGHGAYPHRVGCDPILAASNSVMALQSIVTRQIDATDPIVISVCEIHGGTAKNIIPEKVRFGGSIRCQTPATRNSIEERIRKVLQGVAASYNCTAELDYHYGVPPLVNSPDLMQAVWETASRVVGPENVKRIDIPAMGSEDFSAYLERAPRGFFVRLGIQPPDRAHILFHNGNFVFPEEALPYGTAFFTQFVLDQNGGSGRE